MLSADTKQKILACREILMGQLPLPTDQVELITITLIYKFMDDLDQKSVKMGGKRSFFVGRLERFRWKELISQSLSATERVELFSDGLTNLGDPQASAHLPVLFRDIFKNSILKFKDERILSLFLNEINTFEYLHSEELGNAFEFLLRDMGTQAKNGQFRTPRHIIDFIVEIMEPSVSESILDPACGTAGFLVSAFRHVISKNTNKGSSLLGDKLSSQQRKDLFSKITGYDITPLMVKLSKVNLYFNGFSDPQIHEYDTLTNENRWTEKFDLILANPPFMTPKGGIVPHNKFRIPARKAEVLFTDYISEHLNSNGRAGVIVPEGIIFRKTRNFSALRKMLIEDSLVAVISLPKGVFNPYSDVKTSILILNRPLNRKIKDVLSLKIENDGFDLGDTRRPIDKNDIPNTLKIVRAWINACQTDSKVLIPEHALVVAKEKIYSRSDYNLQRDTYKEGTDRGSEFETKCLGEILDIQYGKRITIKNDKGTLYPVFGGGDESFKTDKFSHSDTIVIARFAMSEQCVRFVAGRFYLLDSGFTVCIKDEYKEKLQQEFINQLLLNSQSRIFGCSRGNAQDNIDIDKFKELKIPLPPIDLQKSIAGEISEYRKIVNHSKNLVCLFKPYIPNDESSVEVQLGQICKIGGMITSKINPGLPYIGADSIETNTGRLLKLDSAKAQMVNGPVDEFKDRRVLYSKIRPYLNKTTTVNIHGYCSSDMYPLEVDESKCLIEYLEAFLLSASFNEKIRNFYERASIPKINREQLFSTKIPIPTLSVQKSIVEQINKEKNIILGLNDISNKFEERIDDLLDTIWEDDPD